MFPLVPRASIVTDLSATRSVEDTIENILSGALSNANSTVAANFLQVRPSCLIIFEISGASVCFDKKTVSVWLIQRSI